MQRAVVGLLVAGWLADLLAREDPDVRAGIEAYEAEDYDTALASYDKAVERLGDRPELDLNRGLALLAQGEVETAKSAFEGASESRDANVRASGHYELGNLALDAEQWDVAIEQYIECLEARPDHTNAKWNLELALQKKKEQEDEEKEQEEQDEKNEDEQDEDEQDEDEQDEDEKQEDEKQEDEQQEDEKQEDEKQDDGKQEDDKQEDEKQEDEKQDEKQEDEQKQDEQEQDQKSQPAPIDQMDIQQALQQLDQEDPFTLDRPSGGYIQPEKDW
jgi:Ca-activated chloride channel family protein